MMINEHTDKQRKCEYDRSSKLKITTVLSKGTKIPSQIMNKMVKSSKHSQGLNNVVRGRRNRKTNSAGGNFGLSSDIRKYFGNSHNIIHSTDNLQFEEVVFEEDEDGFQLINYPIHIDRGFELFSQDNYEEYMDLAQDELRQILSTYWGVYKGDLG